MAGAMTDIDARPRRFVRFRVVAMTALLVLLAGSAGADDVDDAMVTFLKELAALKQDQYEKIFGERQAKLGKLAFRDQAYCVEKSLAKESGWDAPDKPYVFKPSTEGGVVYACTWSSGKKAEAEGAVAIVVTRYNHGGKTRVGDADVPNDDPLTLVQAVSRAWAAGLEPFQAPADGQPATDDAKVAAADRAACVEAVKKAVGVGKVYAASQGRLVAGKKRERREWWAWTGSDVDWREGGGKATWIACARYDESVLSKTNAALTKGGYFMSKVHVYKGVSAK
jgi:hypothetical protein